MSKTYLESMGLHNIDSIDITNSNLGQGINDRFENIGYNFNKILKSEYLRGHSGSNMSTAICEISDSPAVIEDVFYYSKNQSGQVQSTNVSGAGIKNLIGSQLINHYNADPKWVDKIFQHPTTIYFITENDSQGNKYIKTSLPYYIVDPDFVGKYKNLYNTNDVESATNFTDRSCVIYFDTQNEDGCLEVKIYNNIPTIYYDTIVKDFCWRINGERTGISAKGIPGQRGLKGSSFLLGQFKYSEDNEADGYNELFSIYMVNDSGVGKWYEVNDEKQMNELLGITNLDHGSPIIAIGLTENTTQSNTLTTKVVLGVLHISTGGSGKSQYNIAYNSSNMDIGSIISRADYFESLSDSDSLFLNSRDENNHIVQVNVDNYNYNLGHFIKPSAVDSKGNHVLSVGLNMYNYSNTANTKIPASIMGADSKMYIGDAPSNIISILNVNYNELNCKDVISWGQLTAKKGLTADGCDVNITAIKNIGGNLKAAGSITAGGALRVSGNANINNILTVGSSGSFGGNLFVSNIIGHTTDKKPLNIRDGIYIRNSKVSLETMPVKMWQPDNGDYNVSFNDSYVYLQNSYLHVTGNSGSANGNGIYSIYNIKTKNQLIAEDGINVGVKTGGRKIILSGPVQIGNPSSYASDPDHLIYGNLVTRSDLTVQGTVNFNNTLTVTRGLTAKDTLTVTGDTTVNKLTVNNDTTVNKLIVNGPLTVNNSTQITNNITLGNSSNHKHVINGEISISHWVATDAMIKDIFE